VGLGQLDSLEQGLLVALVLNFILDQLLLDPFDVLVRLDLIPLVHTLEQLMVVLLNELVEELVVFQLGDDLLMLLFVKTLANGLLLYFKRGHHQLVRLLFHFLLVKNSQDFV